MARTTANPVVAPPRRSGLWGRIFSRRGDEAGQGEAGQTEPGGSRREDEPGEGGPVSAYGIETEYALVAMRVGAEPVRGLRGEAKPPLSPDRSVDELFAPIKVSAQRCRASRENAGGEVGTEDPLLRALPSDGIAGWGPRDVFLENGARLYVDVGEHPEYASPECARAREAVVADRAGEEIMRLLAESANERLRERGIRLYVLKNNTDGYGLGQGHAWGCHENYQIPRSLLPQIGPGFHSFLATRLALTGAGWVAHNSRGEWSYRLSARAPFIQTEVSSNTMESRPLIAERDEPLAEKRRFARLQLVFADSNVTEATTRLKLALTSAALQLLDEGVSLDDLALEHPILALHEISARGPEGIFVPLRLADGRRMCALDLQEEVISRARSRGIGEDLEIATRAIDALRGRNEAAVASEIDWVGKWQLLRAAVDSSHGDWSESKVMRIQLAYHDVDQKTGLAYRFREAGMMGRVAPEAAVIQALTDAPASRARLRGRFVQEMNRRAVPARAGWQVLRALEPPWRLELPDPLQSTSEQLESFLRA